MAFLGVGMIMRRAVGLAAVLALVLGPALAFAEDGVKTGDDLEQTGVGKVASVAQAQEESGFDLFSGYVLGGLGVAALGAALAFGLDSGGGGDEPVSPPSTQ